LTFSSTLIRQSTRQFPAICFRGASAEAGRSMREDPENGETHKASR
jgi:hypothetical protein